MEKFGLTGAMITAVDLLRGLAELIGWQNIRVPGATGYTDTDYAAKGLAALAALQSTDLVCVHVEAPDEASHEGDLETKIAAIEKIDKKIVAPLFETLNTEGEFRILICPDHPTPIRTKTHSHGWVPFAMAGSGIPVDQSCAYDEFSAEVSENGFAAGHALMAHFIG
jgi:2,3-bisphosphoglycerate-independent phosphoglycerate mutase